MALRLALERWLLPKAPRVPLPSLRTPRAMSHAIQVTKLGLGPAPEDGRNKIHHLKTDKDGVPVKFDNPYPSCVVPGQFLMMRKMIGGLITGKLAWPDTTPPTVNIVKPSFLPGRFDSDELRTTWLGHACHYTEFPSGLRVLFDPVMEDRCSPLSFMGPKRYNPGACAIADLPFIDAVVISHSHYDHLSYRTSLEIAQRHPDAHFFVGLGLASWFQSIGIKNVTELDWWEDAELSVNLADSAAAAEPETDAESEAGPTKTIQAKISCLPAQHNSSRVAGVINTTLWCSWAVRSAGGSDGPGAGPERSVWFGGDTGYRTVPEVPEGTDDWGPEYEHLPRNPQFAQVGALRGPFDLGLIPIGAYAPRHVFSFMHADPQDAVEIFRDTRCARALAIHWGTWALTTEPVLEPPRLLRAALRRRGLAEEGTFDVCDIGETRTF